jgi:5'-nucleotidase
MCPYQIDSMLSVAVASSALFDLRASDAVFRDRGLDAYREYQRKRESKPLQPGVAFAFIQRLLAAGRLRDSEMRVEVVLLSRNDPDTGLRVMRSIEHYGLDITRGAFANGKSPFKYMDAFNASLFLSANQDDIREAIRRELPAGQVLGAGGANDPGDRELRVAFDFDGVLVGDAAESIYQKHGLLQFHASERARANVPHEPGPMLRLLTQIAELQAARRRARVDKVLDIRTSIVTARNAPAHERLVTTLRNLGVTVDEAIFLGGIEKRRVLEVLRPHIFFDDQLGHLDPGSNLPLVHVPFGAMNARSREGESSRRSRRTTKRKDPDDKRRGGRGTRTRRRQR